MFSFFSTGDDILVAPMVTPGLFREIYLPKGFWRDQLRRVSWRGPRWLERYEIQQEEVRIKTTTLKAKNIHLMSINRHDFLKVPQTESLRVLAWETI